MRALLYLLSVATPVVSGATSEFEDRTREQVCPLQMSPQLLKAVRKQAYDGNVQAENRLFVYYLQRDAIKRARFWATKGAKQGSPLAAYNLSQLWWSEFDNLDEARRWAVFAKQRGYIHARELLRKIDSMIQTRKLQR